LLRAFMRMETVEHFARISLVTQLLGRQTLLSREEVEKLAEARQKYFGALGAPVAPLSEVCPVTADPSAPLRATGRLAGTPLAARDRFWVSREELEALIDEAVKSAKVR
jgi:L-fuculose-phosphate aldolase